jgi:hypothetical protein
MNQYKKIKNNPSKFMVFWMIASFLILEIIFIRIISKIWGIILILNSYFIFFVFKELNYNEEILEIYYPIRPIFRKIKIPVKKIKIVSFMAYGGNGPNSSPFIRFVLTKYPFFVEFRVKESEEILDFFRTVAENNTFTVKSRMKQNHYVINDLKKQGITSKLKFKGE